MDKETNCLASIQAELQHTDPDQEIDTFVKLLCQYQVKIKGQDKGARPTEGLRAAIMIDAIHTPDQLIHQMHTVYSDLTIRFDFAQWEALVQNVIKHAEGNLQSYCLPIAQFLQGHSFLLSDVFLLIRKSFPWDKWYDSPDWRVWCQEDQQTTRFVREVLEQGNLELDLLIQSIPTEGWESKGMDDLLEIILHGSVLCRQGQDQESFQMLSRTPAETRPVVVWQRMMELVYRASVTYGVEHAQALFPQVMAEAMIYYPEDEGLLFLQNSFRFETRPTFETKEEIIKTLKNHPEHERQMFLLGRCYLRTNQNQQAYKLLQQLADRHPLNLDYASYAARALDAVLSQPVDQADKRVYLERMLQQLELEIYELIEIPDSLADDPDIMALKHYAYSASRRHMQGGHEPTYYPQDTKKAMEMAQDGDVQVFLYWKYRSTFGTLDDLLEIHDLVLDYFEEFPERYETAFAAGELHLAQGNNEQAYACYDMSSQLNPEYIFNYLGKARAALRMGDHEKCLAAGRVYVHSMNYWRQGHYCIGKSYFDHKEYKEAYGSFKWMVQLEGGKPSIHDQYLLVASLRNFLLELPEADRLSYISSIDEGLQLFDDLPKQEEFVENNEGSGAYLYASEICEMAGYAERGLQYIDQVVHYWHGKNIMVNKEQAWVKVRLLRLLNRYHEAHAFLEEHINDLKHLGEKPEEIAHFEPLLAEIAKQLESETELSGKLRSLIRQSAEDPARWRATYQQMMFHAMMSKEFPVMLATGTRYFELYQEPGEDDVFMAFWLADAHVKTENPEKAKAYWKRCLEAGALFPYKYGNLISMAQMKLNPLN
ncbi:hypothetical protein BFP72_02445 [Reichenbachiella sp. 5M10]|nr:hypothetical protein BFP72_02445 [Reichenbachiella sp. 5M10]